VDQQALQEFRQGWSFGGALKFMFEAHDLAVDLVGWDTSNGWNP